MLRLSLFHIQGEEDYAPGFYGYNANLINNDILNDSIKNR